MSIAIIKNVIYSEIITSDTAGSIELETSEGKEATIVIIPQAMEKELEIIKETIKNL